MALVLITGPAAEPLTLAEAKLHLKVDAADEDSLIQNLIQMVRQAAEEETGLALISQTWRLYLDAFPRAAGWWDGVRDGAKGADLARTIELPRPPLLSLTHIKTFDEADVASVVPATDYFIDSASRPGRIALRPHAAWPHALRPANAVEIEYQAGFGVAPSNVPMAIRQGMLQQAAARFAARGDGPSQWAEAPIPPAALALYRPYRIPRL
jgi:hypothetical protein